MSVISIVHSLIFQIDLVTDQKARNVLFAFCINLRTEPGDSLLKALLVLRNIKDVDDAVRLSKEPCGKGSFLLCLQPKSHVHLRIAFSWQVSRLEVIVTFLTGGMLNCIHDDVTVQVLFYEC